VLTVTPQAAAMIDELAGQARLPDGGGLRIAQRVDQPSLGMALVEAPDPDDAVLDQHRVRVFLDPCAAGRLAGQVLDSRADDRGAAFFLAD